MCSQIQAAHAKTQETNIKAWDTLGKPWWIQPKVGCGRNNLTVGHTHFLFSLRLQLVYISLLLLSLGQASWLSSSQWNVNSGYAPPPSHNPLYSSPFRKLMWKRWVILATMHLRWRNHKTRRTWITEKQHEKPPTSRNTWFVTDISVP